MKRKNIVLLAIIAVVVLAGIFTTVYLNNRDKGTELEDFLTQEESDVKSGSLKEAVLTFYFEAQEPAAAKEVLGEIERKVKDKLNIRLDFKYIWDYPEGYLDQMKTLIASGQPCDAFYFSRGFPRSLQSLVQENLVKDISDIFPRYAPNYFKKFGEREIAALSVGRNIYAIPNRLPTSQMRCAMVREDLMGKYNITDIKNYDDYEVYLKAIRDNESGMVPMIFWETAIGLFAEANGYVILDYQQGLVYKWDDPEMKVLAWEQTPEFKKGIETIYQWHKKGYLLNDLPVAQIDSTVVSSGKWGSFISTFGADFEYNSILMSKNISWRYKTYPLYPDKPSARNSPLEGAMVIGAKSVNAERVLMFVDWLQSSQENYDALMYGIKGKHYTLENDSVKLPEGVAQNESYSSWGWRWPFTNIEYERVDNSSTGQAVKKYYQTILEKTKYPPHTGFEPDYKALLDITALRQRSFGAIEQEIFTGSFTPEDVDTYIKEQKDLGADKLVNEIQRQLDIWKKESK